MTPFARYRPQLMTYRSRQHRLPAQAASRKEPPSPSPLFLAHALLDAGFNGAVFFVDLGALTDPKLLPTTDIRAQVYDASPGSAAELAGLYWREESHFSCSTIAATYDRTRQLHCEQIVSETHADARPGSEPRSSSTRVEGEHIHLLLSPYRLSAPKRGNDSGSSAQSIRLFSFSWSGPRQAVSADAVLSDSDAPVVATICRTIDGIALAIELRGEVTPNSLRMSRIAELLANRFTLLWRGRRTALPPYPDPERDARLEPVTFFRLPKRLFLTSSRSSWGISRSRPPYPWHHRTFGDRLKKGRYGGDHKSTCKIS